VGLGFPPAHVQSYFAQNGFHYFNSVNAGQVYSPDALEFVLLDLHNKTQRKLVMA
jgi:hypothetical protein